MKKIISICLAIILLCSTAMTAYATEPPRGEDEAGSAIIADRDSVTVKNAEAEAVFKEFLDAVGFIATEPTWNGEVGTFLHYYSIYANSEHGDGENYAKCVSGGTKEDYLAMSMFDRFLWMETYVYLASAIMDGNRSYYLDSKETYKSRLTDCVVSRMTGTDAETVKAAYLKLMDWQYDYIMAHGVPFNFINNSSYLDEIKTTEPAAPTQSPEPGNDPIEKPSQTEQVPAETAPEEEKGIWEDTITALSRNLISIAIIIVFGSVLLALYIVRKRNNIDTK